MATRLFVSIDLPPKLHDAIETVQSSFGDIPGVRCTDPTQTHVTLKFLGDVEEARLEDVKQALEGAVHAAETGPFTARFGHLGVFPEFDYISVIWIGVPEGGSAMEALHESIEDGMVALGFDEERHTFTPHVTIARVEHGEGKEQIQELLRTEDPIVGEMRVRSVTLTESTLTGEGPRYETVATVEL